MTDVPGDTKLSPTARKNRDELKLAVCQECGNVMFPPRARCSNCLADQIEFQPVDDKAVVLATTVLHRSLESSFADKMPWHIALVKMDAGPVAIVNGFAKLQPGQRVKLESQANPMGREIPVLTTRKTDF